MKPLNLRARDEWSDGSRKAVIVGGTLDTVQVRIEGNLREFSVRYFAQKFSPVSVPRYRS